MPPFKEERHCGRPDRPRERKKPGETGKRNPENGEQGARLHSPDYTRPWRDEKRTHGKKGRKARGVLSSTGKKKSTKNGRGIQGGSGSTAKTGKDCGRGFYKGNMTCTGNRRCEGRVDLRHLKAGNLSHPRGGTRRASAGWRAFSMGTVFTEEGGPPEAGASQEARPKCWDTVETGQREKMPGSNTGENTSENDAATQGARSPANNSLK